MTHIKAFLEHYSTYPTPIIYLLFNCSFLSFIRLRPSLVLLSPFKPCHTNFCNIQHQFCYFLYRSTSCLSLYFSAPYHGRALASVIGFPSSISHYPASVSSHYSVNQASLILPIRLNFINYHWRQEF